MFLIHGSTLLALAAENIAILAESHQATLAPLNRQQFPRWVALAVHSATCSTPH